MHQLARLGRESMHSLDWKHGPSHTTGASVTYVFKCHFANKQKCLFRIQFTIQLGGVSSNPTDFVHVQQLDRALIHADHVIHLSYSANCKHQFHEATPLPNQGPPGLWMAECRSNPLCLQFTRAQISQWLHIRHLLGEPADQARIIHACKTWCVRERRRQGLLCLLHCEIACVIVTRVTLYCSYRAHHACMQDMLCERD